MGANTQHTPLHEDQTLWASIGKSPISIAYAAGNAIIAARHGAGFRLLVTMHTGAKFDVVPTGSDALNPEHVEHLWFWTVDHGGATLVLKHSEIESIEVIEV